MFGRDGAENERRGEEVLGKLGMGRDVVEDHRERDLGPPSEGDREPLHRRKDGGQPLWERGS